MRCRRTDEAGNKIKEKKKRKEGGREFAEVVLDESKRSFSCFSTGIYNILLTDLRASATYNDIQRC